MRNEWAFVSLQGLGEALRAGDITSRELTEYFLERLEQNGPKLNALVTLTRERALREADRADADFAAGVDHSPLQGIPYGAKDLLETADYPTSWGAEPFRNQQFDRDAAVIQRLAAAGAVLIGKLAMVELAGGWGYNQPNNSLTGPGLNAWDATRWTGGSSSGSGAAVGAGFVPFAIGTETWGSIHCPSSFNGITGLRPTYGRVCRAGAMALSWTMDKIGPMTRSASDAWLVLQAIAGPDGADQTTLGAPPLTWNGAGRPLRIGLLENSIEKSAPLVGANARAALGVLQGVGSITTMQLPDLPYDDAAGMVITCEAGAAFQDFIERGGSAELRAPEVHANMWAALTVPAVDYLRAIRIRARGVSEMQRVFEQFDLLVAPAYAVTAPLAEGSFEAHYDEYPAPRLGAMGNLLGLPSISVPTGLGENGMPTSLEILGQWWNEALVVQCAELYQGRTTFHTAQPPQWDVTDC